VVSSGRIKATVTAVERVHLLKTAIMIGEVHAPVLMMEEGAKLQGTTDMGVTAWPDELPKLAGTVRELTAHRGKHVAVVEKDSDD
jgi:cytoskeletal protein CcmA (bactofilin family)